VGVLYETKPGGHGAIAKAQTHTPPAPLEGQALVNLPSKSRKKIHWHSQCWLADKYSHKSAGTTVRYGAHCSVHPLTLIMQNTSHTQGRNGQLLPINVSYNRRELKRKIALGPPATAEEYLLRVR